MCGVVAIKLINTYQKLTKDKKLTLGFIGGSITRGCSAKANIVDGTVVSRDGDVMRSYVNRVATWFKEEFPEADIKTVNAGISDTATNFGIYRLEQNLMNTDGHDMPDLVFVEFTTNDFSYPTQTGVELEVQAESIFRNIWSHNPYAEIVFISTNVTSTSSSIAAYRKVCEHYDISFADVGKALFECKSGRGHEKETAGNFYYTVDNLHPSAEGYRVYLDVIKPILARDLSIETGVYCNHLEELPKPLSSVIIDNPSIVTADNLILKGNAQLKEGALLAGLYGTELTIQTVGFEKKYADISGECEITAEFKNTALGILVDLTGIGFELDWQVDGGDWKHFEVNKNHFAFQLYEHPQVWMLEHHLDKGAHKVTLKFSKDTAIKLGGLIVNGGK